jgi:hypothetical protein
VTGTFTDPLNDVVNAVVSHAAASGLFGKVNGHEPKGPPVTGRNPDLTCAVWVDMIRPAMSSGLSATSVILDLNVRLFLPAFIEPPDAIDPTMLGACHRLMAAYVGDFTLGGTARTVDVRGMGGKTMSAAAGYVEMSGKLFRVMTITLPVIVNDLWTEAP